MVFGGEESSNGEKNRREEEGEQEEEEEEEEEEEKRSSKKIKGMESRVWNPPFEVGSMVQLQVIELGFRTDPN